MVRPCKRDLSFCVSLLTLFLYVHRCAGPESNPLSLHHASPQSPSTPSQTQPGPFDTPELASLQISDLAPSSPGTLANDVAAKQTGKAAKAEKTAGGIGVVFKVGRDGGMYVKSMSQAGAASRSSLVQVCRVCALQQRAAGILGVHTGENP